jgi:hypothetical protein
MTATAPRATVTRLIPTPIGRSKINQRLQSSQPQGARLRFHQEASHYHPAGVLQEVESEECYDGKCVNPSPRSGTENEFHNYLTLSLFSVE